MQRTTTLLCMLFSALFSLGSAADKPNIVFILADDLGYSELGSYGQKKIKTPNLDMLARQGMKFTRAYSGNAVCAPSRCVLMTGKHPGHATVRNNRAIKPEGQHPISDRDVTIAERLMKEGYTCGAFGKWGLGNIWSEGDPNDQGFDRFFGFNCQGHAHSYYPSFLRSDQDIFPLNNDPPVPGHASLPKGADPNEPRSYDQFKGKDYASDRINEQALEFINTNKDRPFFLYYPTIIPHVALHVPDEELEPYLAEQWPETPFTREGGYGYTPHLTPKAAYAAMITRMDTYIGRILKQLDKLNLRHNTIIVFTSDNGTTHLKDEVDYDFFESVKPLRGLKGSLYEGGIRVPQIVSWPGKIEPGSVSDYMTGFEDWMPTLIDLLGGKTVPEPGDGISIAPTLLGRKQKEREFLYREFAAYGGQQAIWMGKWKGIRQNMLKFRGKPAKKNPLTIELYNLDKDISESNDLATEHPEIVKKLAERMKRERVPSAAFPFKPID